MPELPEVETIRQGLKEKILNQKITKVQVKKKRLVRNRLKDFLNILINNQFTNINRIGKLLILTLADHHYLLIHLKMTGQLIYVSKNDLVIGGHRQAIGKLPNKYSHIIFTFQDKSQLFFNDLRQFGYLQIVDNTQEIIDKYGIEPLTKEFTLNNFQDIFKKRKGILKPLLLNQTIIAGLGNIYVDEVCFQAKVLPTRQVNTLDTKEITKLYQACQQVIKKAVTYRGTTFSDYKDTAGKAGNFVQYLKVYGRSNERCLNCKQSTIKKIRLAGRGTHYCPQCQK